MKAKDLSAEARQRLEQTEEGRHALLAVDALPIIQKLEEPRSLVDIKWGRIK